MGTTFQDSAGREWAVRLDDATLDRASEAGLDLAAAANSLRSLGALVADPVALPAALYLTCDAWRVMAREEFSAGLGREGAQRGAEALTEALAEAYPDSPAFQGMTRVVKASLERRPPPARSPEKVVYIDTRIPMPPDPRIPRVIFDDEGDS